MSRQSTSARNEEAQAAGVVPYDFRRPNRVSKDRFRTIQAIYDRLVSAYGLVIQQTLRTQVGMELASLEQMTFGEYSSHLNKPCSAFIYVLDENGNNSGVMDFGQDLPFFVIDRLFGGQGETFDEVRPLTPTERNAFRGQVVDRMLSLYKDAWQDHISFAPRFEHFEFTPEVMEVALREDPVLVAVFRMTVGEMTSTFSLCIPVAALETFLAGTGEKAGSHRGRPRQTEADIRSLQENLRDASITVSVELSPFRLAVEEVGSLRVGSIVHTGVPMDSDFDVRLGNRAYFRAKAGRSGMLIGITITDAFLTAEEALSRNPKGKIIMTDETRESVPAPQVSGPATLEQLHDLSLPIRVVIGQTTLTVSQILKLGRGSVLELDRFAGDPADIYVGDKLFAEGEIVQSNEHYGIKISNLLAPRAVDGGAEGEATKG